MQNNSNETVIYTESLCRSFDVRLKAKGIAASLKNFIFPRSKVVNAVKNLNLTIQRGEIVGFLGPNGAGKTTTLKMLSGLLNPSSGTANVLGYYPFDRDHAFLNRISLVMGQKQNLWWDLPPIETFEIHRRIYRIADNDYEQRYKELVEMLEIHDCLETQTRRLSLGQRMRCELAVSLLHHPDILFLDEPTIGLDVLMQKKIRSFLLDYQKRFKPTILLTSHYMDDVAALAKRVVIISSGSKIFDGEIKTLTEKIHPEKIISCVINNGTLNLPESSEYKVIHQQGLEYKFLAKPENVSKVAAKLYETGKVADLNIQDAPLQDVIGKLFQDKCNNES